MGYVWCTMEEISNAMPTIGFYLNFKKKDTEINANRSIARDAMITFFFYKKKKKKVELYSCKLPLISLTL